MIYEPSDRDWLEDAGTENGDYVCKCALCSKPFGGHKRRVICKKCDAEKREIDAAMEI